MTHKPNFCVPDADGNNYWISRSTAVVALPFFHAGGRVAIPIGRRSPDSELFPNNWAVVSGFLDWGETAAQALIRECKEKIGLDLKRYVELDRQPTYVWTSSNGDQTVSLRFVVTICVDQLPVLTGSEEMQSPIWLDVSRGRLPDYMREKSNIMAFNHAELIDWGLREERKLPLNNVYHDIFEKELM